nr:bZIP transcription factor 46-like [Coffea arabica]XP_027094183.1 bZIP transcription factor 46-like [Coffea arabica]
MGSHFNFKNFGNEQMEGSGGGRPPGNFPLARQPSVYSLTFDEFQTTMGGVGKDFGSMNMDELLKNIWSAEEFQTMGPASQDVGASGGHLQRQGSLTLPRTLSQKTVDQVWRDISKEFTVGAKDTTGVGITTIPQRQQTLGEMTLEDFLLRAGVVREDAQLAGKPNITGLLGDLSRTANNQAFGFGYQPPERNTGLVSGRVLESSNQMAMESANLPLNVNGVRFTQQQLGATQTQQTQQLPQQQHQPLFPKLPGLPYATPIAIPNSAQLGSPGVRGGIVGLSDPATSASLVQNGALQGAGVGMVNLGAGAVTIAAGSPAVSSDGLAKSNGDTSSVSPVPYVFNGGLRGRKCSALEKVVERRQRRMIKNRESAARSRARKQAYTMELEAEVAKLKEDNQELQKKQAEIMEMQKNQVMEEMNQQRGGKRRCLRRTQTGPW